MINGDVIGQVLTRCESKIPRRDIVPRVCDISQLITIHGLIINSVYLALLQRAQTRGAARA